MSASPAVTPRNRALDAVAESLRRVADALAELAAEPAAGPRLVSTREPEQLLTLAEAAELLKVSDRTVRRLVRRHPAAVRRVGRVVRYERGELFRAVRKG